MKLRVVNSGLLLQLVFVLFYLLQVRTFVLKQFGILAVAYIELTLIVSSLILGIIALMLKAWSKSTLFLILFGLLSCLWFIVIYLLPESGVPPAIPWFYPN